MTVDPRLRPFRAVVCMFAAFLAVVATSAAVLFVLKLGFTSAEVVRFYRGDEAAFIQPKSFAGLTKIAVPHLLAIPVTLFITIHLVGFAGVVRRGAFAWAARLAFFFAALGIAAGYLVRFVSPQLAFAKVVAFVGLEALLAFWLALVVGIFWPRSSGAELSEAAREAPPRGWMRERATWRR